MKVYVFKGNWCQISQQTFVSSLFHSLEESHTGLEDCCGEGTGVPSLVDDEDDILSPNILT